MAVFGPAAGPGQSVGARIPYLLVAYLLLTLYSVVRECIVHMLIQGYQFDGKHFDDRVRSPYYLVAGVFLLVLSVSAKLFWLGSWAYALWISHGPGCYSPPVTRAKRIMHSDRPERMTIEHGGPASNARFRRCRKTGCHDTTPYGDRVYHCSKMNRHYPLYDHYCHWLWIPVYMETMKPYMCHMFWILLDSVANVILSIWAASITARGLRLLHLAVAILSAGLAIYLSSKVGLEQLEMLCFRNVVTAERRMNEWTMARIVQTTRGDRVQFVSLLRSQDDRRKKTNWHPWALSPAENFRQLFGESVWTWPLFWVKPRRVKQYGRWPGTESDLPLGPFWRQWERDPAACNATQTELLPMPRFAAAVRRGQARSSGVEIG